LAQAAAFATGAIALGSLSGRAAEYLSVFLRVPQYLHIIWYNDQRVTLQDPK
jgi:hypothetical protein